MMVSLPRQADNQSSHGEQNWQDSYRWWRRCLVLVSRYLYVELKANLREVLTVLLLAFSLLKASSSTFTFHTWRWKKKKMKLGRCHSRWLLEHRIIANWTACQLWTLYALSTRWRALGPVKSSLTFVSSSGLQTPSSSRSARTLG